MVFLTRILRKHFEMAAIDLKIKTLQKQQELAEKSYQAAAEKLSCTNDPDTAVKLEETMNQWYEKMTRLENELETLKNVAQVTPNIAQNETDLREALYDLNYVHEVQEFELQRRSLTPRPQVGSFLLHGQEGAGQRWLLHRLVECIPKRDNPPQPHLFISFDFKMPGLRNSDKLWEELAHQVYKDPNRCPKINGKPNQTEISRQLHQWLKKQSVILVADNAQKLQENQFNDILNHFWLPLAENTKHDLKFMNKSWLLLFLLDHKGQPESEQFPHLFKLTIAHEFCDHDLIEWFDYYRESLTISQTTRLDELVSEILEYSGGIPEYAFERICYHCNWEKGVDAWLKF